MVRFLRSITSGAAARAGATAVLALTALASTCVLAGMAAAAWAAEPKPWQLGMQAPATPVQERIDSFHDWLLVITFLITAFVLGLLVYVMVRFHHTRNPVPTRTSHNTVIEILWTVVPVFILGAIFLPSLKLMYYMDREPNADMTIKVIAHQWYWSYEYPDQGNLSFDSNLIPDKDLKPGQKRLLDVDNPLVVPVGAKVRVQITGTDVIHSWFVPSFGVQEYAVVGRLNESWFQVQNSGTYYGECNQICGVNHAFMPIKVVALAKPEFDKWLGEAKKKFAAATPQDGSRTGGTGGEAAPAAVVTAAAAIVAPASEKPAGN
jgi:cytochrome c oxidase subunit 2